MYYRNAASCDNGLSWDSSASIAVYVNHNNYYMDNAADGGSDANDGSEGSPWATMVYALTQMTCGDTLDIKEGTYKDAITIADNTQEIYIRGAGRTTTIFDGDQTERWLEVLGSTSKGITITDMTIKDMKATNEEGLGIKVNGGTKILIEDITFDNCSTSSSTWGGGGIATFGASQVKVNRCIFTNNWGGSGSGIHFESTNRIDVVNCLFYDNDAASSETYYGGEFFSYSSGTSYITNCTFTENGNSRADINIYNGISYIKNCIIYNNSSSDAIEERWASGVHIFNNIFDTGTDGTINTNTNSEEITMPTFEDASNDVFDLSDSSPQRNR